jgi:hypothetical protein
MMGDGKKLGMDHSSWPLSVQQSINTPRALEYVRQVREKMAEGRQRRKRCTLDDWEADRRRQQGED